MSGHSETGQVLKCLLLILILFICFILSFKNDKPKCYIVDFYVPSLDTHPRSNTSRTNAFIFFDLKLENVMPFNGLRYDNVNLTFSYSYGGNRSTTFVPIAQYTVPGFYQGHRKTAHKRDVTRTYGVLWEHVFVAVSNGSVALFRVDLATKVKSKQYFWYAKKHGLMVGGNVDVGKAGLKEPNKAIRLR